MRRVCKILFVIFLTVSPLSFCGCNLLEQAAEDIYSWDMSACVSNFGTCWELFSDNADKFEDSFVEAMSGIGK